MSELAAGKVEHPYEVIVADGGQQLSGRIERHARHDRQRFR